MAIISLEGIRLRAFHGVHEEEKILGSDFEIDIEVEIPTGPAAKSDDLEKTVNYETIYQAVKIEMAERHNLIETVLENIVDRLKFQFQNLHAVRVKIRKSAPPLGGRVACSAIEERKTFLTECPRDKKQFVCYNDERCWCRDPAKPTWPATQEVLKGQYKKCLCPTCVAFFAG